MRLPKLTFGRVLAGTAVVLIATTGTAYAANTVGSSDIIDNSVASVDIKNSTIRSQDILDESVRGQDIQNNSVTTDDVAPLHGDNDIQDNTITTFDIATDAIDSDEVLDFGLTNEDIGVLEAEVNADGTLASSDHFGTTSFNLGTGLYEVDFARNVSSCTPVVTQGEAGVGGAGGAITGVTDRAGNTEAFFVTTRDSAGSTINTSFHIIVVC